jgi:catechol 2,3-dioxygenase-like lactoylglutathione lyase family enzyme
MSTLESFRKQARQLVRWHREGQHTVGGRIRKLARYREITDVAALKLKFPLAEAQEIIAVENGYASWAALKKAAESGVRADSPARASGSPVLTSAIPMLFVSNVRATAEFFRDKLGFGIDFLHGNPPFYGSVSRGGARLHLRFVHEPAFAAGIVEKEGLLAAFINVEDVKSLFAEYLAAGVEMHSRLKKEPWGGPAFTICDPDGNRLHFVGPERE